jgi:signal transduction histidine kinase
MEKEREQMVALIGNVAHDLKTPLQSFHMDLEVLKSDENIKKINDMHCSPEDGAGTFCIIKSLESTCCFMTMAINR